MIRRLMYNYIMQVFRSPWASNAFAFIALGLSIWNFVVDRINKTERLKLQARIGTIFPVYENRIGIPELVLEITATNKGSPPTYISGILLKFKDEKIQMVLLPPESYLTINKALPVQIQAGLPFSERIRKSDITKKLSWIGVKTSTGKIFRSSMLDTWRINKCIDVAKE
jgi:hypothetical protein